MTPPEAPYVLLVNGMPGAGKSTVSRRVAERLDRSALLDARVGCLLVNGGVWALGEPADEAARQVELGNRNLSVLAVNFAAAGFTPVIDTIVPDRAQLDFCLDQMAPRPVAHVVLAPGIDHCRQRNATREPDQRWDFDGYERLEQEMADELGDAGWWIDSSSLTVEQTVDLILREAPDHLTRGA